MSTRPPHGIERAAARVYELGMPKSRWDDVNDSVRYRYRGLVRSLIRDAGPSPEALAEIPRFWFSPSEGRLIAASRDDQDVELPDDAVELAPIQGRAA